MTQPSTYLHALTADGLFSKNKNEITIFLSIFNKRIIRSNNLRDLIETTYHEIRHHYQKNAPKNYYEIFLLHMEDIILNFSKWTYEERYRELDAFYYGKRKTKEYLCLNDAIYDFWLDYYEYKLKTFNPNLYFEKFHKIVTKNYTSLPSFFQFFYNTFYNEDLTFKSIYEIMKQIEKEPIHLEILTTIFSSTVFLKQLNFNTLTKDELRFLELILVEKIKLLAQQTTITTNYYNKLKETSLPSKKKLRYIMTKVLFILVNINENKKEINRYKKKFTHLISILNETKQIQKTKQIN